MAGSLINHIFPLFLYNLFIYLGFYIAFNTVQVMSGPVVGRAEETSTYSSSVRVRVMKCRVLCTPWDIKNGVPQCENGAQVILWHILLD